jgi:uncharacterized Zn finger protein (UPF0148 family)
VAILRVGCPECGAGLKSKTGFTPGETVCCPKCETYFAVEEPDEDEEESKPAKGKKPVTAVVEDDDEEDEKPRKKKKKKRGDDEDEDEKEWSYKNSWLRYVVLGILVIVMCVLGYMLVLKKKREAEDANAKEDDNTPAQAGGAPNPAPGPGPGPGPGAPLPGGIGITMQGGGPGGKMPAKGDPNMMRAQTRLVGKWQKDEPIKVNGADEVHSVEYGPDGVFTYTAKVDPKPRVVIGRWDLLSVTPNGVRMRVMVGGQPPREVAVNFQENAILQPRFDAAEPESHVFRRVGGGPSLPPPAPKGGLAGVMPPLDLKFGATPPADSAEGKKLQESLRQKLVGVWEGTTPGGATRRVEYKADGTFTDSEKDQSGKWQVAGLIGTKGLKLDRGGKGPVRVVFEDDELVHDGDAPGESVVLRKK